MSATASQFIAKAEQQLGVPYVWGGDTPAGFDCSGLVFWDCQQFGIECPRTSQEQWTFFPRTNHPQPGDLVFFDVPADGPSQPGHVGIYLGPGQMIDAPERGQTVSIQPFPFRGGTVMGYGHPPFITAPPPPPPVTEDDMAISSSTDPYVPESDPQRHLYQEQANGSVLHWWQPMSTGKWAGPETLPAKPA